MSQDGRRVVMVGRRFVAVGRRVVVVGRKFVVVVMIGRWVVVPVVVVPKQQHLSILSL